jgi:integrase
MRDAFRLYFGPIKDIRASELTPTRVATWHGNLGNKHGKTTANRALQLLKAIFNRARIWDIIPFDNPTRGVKQYQIPSRTRYLQSWEVHAFFEALNHEGNETIRDFLLISLFTGARRGNVLAMRWDEIDFASATWRIPRTKNGSSQLVPLIDPALDILERRLNTAVGDWVFPGRYGRGHLTRPYHALYRILREAKIRDFCLHDLRRTLASWEVATGATLPVIAATLNHKDFSTTAIYARLNVEPVREAIAKAVGALLDIARE